MTKNIEELETIVIIQVNTAQLKLSEVGYNASAVAYNSTYISRKF